MSAIRKSLSNFQASNPEKFNPEVLNMRNKEYDGLGLLFERLFKSLKLDNYVKFVSSELITDELEQRKYYELNYIPVERSRLSLIVAKFILTIDGEEKHIEFKQFFPKLDTYFFNLAGNRYFALYQIVEKNFYATSKSLYLKTLLMPLGVKFSKFSFKTMQGESIDAFEYKAVIFAGGKDKNDKNLALYYFIEKKENALDYLFSDKENPNTVYFFEGDYVEKDGYDAVMLKKNLFLYFKIDHPKINHQNYMNLIATCVSCLKGIRKTLDTMFSDENYFKKKIIPPTAKIIKADKAINSLYRILDEVTKEKLQSLDPECNKDTLSVLRYMAVNFNELLKLDTVDISNRRLRLIEYMIYPLLIKFSNASYRILNSRNLNIKRLEGMFAFNPFFIVRNLINNELLRYSNSTSTLEIFQVALRYSARGPQALGANGSGVQLKYRAVHPSYLGTIGLSMASASDPGMTGTITPMTKNIKDMSFLG